MFSKLSLLVGFCCLSSSALVSCREEQPYVIRCEDGPVDSELFNDDLNPGVLLNDVSTSKLHYDIIQDEHEMYVKLSIPYLRKKIDFKSESLIVLSMNLVGKQYVVSQTVEADCTKNKLIINATLNCGACTDSGVSYAFVIVPKVPSNTKIEFIPTYVR